MSRPDQFRRLAVLAVRVMALSILLFGARSVIYAVLVRGSGPGIIARLDAIIQGGGSIALWFLSKPLGRLVSAGLDDGWRDG